MGPGRHAEGHAADDAEDGCKSESDRGSGPHKGKIGVSRFLVSLDRGIGGGCREAV
jgi:hypothetical protein